MILRRLKTWTILNFAYNYIFYPATLTAFREYLNHNQERSHNIVLRTLPDRLRRSLQQRNNELWILPTVNENSERPNGWFASSLVFVHTKDTGVPYIRLDYNCKLCGQLVRGLEPRIVGRIEIVMRYAEASKILRFRTTHRKGLNGRQRKRISN